MAILCGCAQTVDLRASHFAVPVVPAESFSGQVNLVGTSTTRVRLMEDVYTTPPTDGAPIINKDLDLMDLIPINFLSLDLELALAKGAQLFTRGSMLGLRWQFLNHGSKGENWVAAIHGAGGGHTKSTITETNGTSTEATSSVNSSQLGLSIGYQFSRVPFSRVAPYIAYIYEDHRASTQVKQNTTSYGPYDDSGRHQYASLGISSHGEGFSYGAEINWITIEWSGGALASQTAAGFRLGWAW